MRSRSFVVGDLMLRLKQRSTKKLEPPWEGPYLVKEVIPGGAYRLQDLQEEKDERNPLNMTQLLCFYYFKVPLFLSLFVVKRLQHPENHTMPLAPIK
jgi:hypothetical protein